MTTTGTATRARYLFADIALAWLILAAFAFAATLSTGALVGLIVAGSWFTDCMSGWTRAVSRRAQEWTVARRAARERRSR